MVQKQQVCCIAGKQARSTAFIDTGILGEGRRHTVSDPSKKDPDRPPFGPFALLYTSHHIASMEAHRADDGSVEDRVVGIVRLVSVGLKQALLQVSPNILQRLWAFDPDQQKHIVSEIIITVIAQLTERVCVTDDVKIKLADEDIEESDVTAEENLTECLEEKGECQEEQESHRQPSEDGQVPNDCVKKSKRNVDSSMRCRQCEVCGAVVQDLSRHLRTHGDRKRVTCEICRKSFKGSALLSQHRRIMHQPKSYVCHLCGYRCGNKSKLDIHMRYELDIKPYVCDLCGRRFVSGTKMRQHSRVHTGEKPHQCHICGLRISRKKYLVDHLKTQHKIDAIANPELIPA
ncbi:unnamed protein product, partial [Cyprideis torosa]